MHYYSSGIIFHVKLTEIILSEKNLLHSKYMKNQHWEDEKVNLEYINVLCIFLKKRGITLVISDICA